MRSYGCDKRKYLFPVVRELVAILFVPSLPIVPVKIVQLVVVKLVFCNNVQFVQDDDHDMTRFFANCFIANVGVGKIEALMKTERVPLTIGWYVLFPQIKSTLPSLLTSAATTCQG